MATNNRVLESFLKELVANVDGMAGQWTGDVEGVPLVVLTDETHDRMRIMAPVVHANALAPADLVTLLEANFDRALDARYASSRGVLWAVYVHPLSSLTKAEFQSAVKQVVALKHNYGSSYASSDLLFRGGGSEH